MNDDRGWYCTFEMPEKTAKAVRDEKSKKYETNIVQVAPGKWIVKYRKALTFKLKARSWV